MTVPSLPDFERTIRLSQGNLDAAELAECHGLLCGLLCRETSGSASDYMAHLGAMQLLINPAAALAAIMEEAYECTRKQLEDEEFGFNLWLPDDDESLETRTISLAQWCSGFLAGLGSGGQLDALSEEAKEAIDDLQQIGRAEISTGLEENEEDETAYAEIVEYVRVVALMMREDFRGPGLDEAIH